MSNQDNTVFSPNNSNPSTPPGPRDKDEWLAIVVALGVLGAAGGWILTGGFSSFRLADVSTELPEVEVFSEPLTEDFQPEEVPDATELDTTDLRSNQDARQSPRSAQEEAEAAAEAESRRSNDTEAEADRGSFFTPSTVPSQSQSPSPDTPASESVDVPEPAVPSSEETTELPVVREPLSFSDVPADYWAKPYIDALTARGVLNGLPGGTYAPERPMTRAEFATQIAQAFKVADTQSAQDFTDIPADYWAASTIQEAVMTGFMKGYPGQVFQPDQTVPRAQVLVAIATGLSLPESSAATLQSYTDQSDVPTWATDKVAAALEAGLVSPPSNTPLRPNEPATRAEVAAILYNALVYMGKVDPI